MRFRRPTQDPLEINLTPLIDCLLFLLIFFMLSTSFTRSGRLHLSLPRAQTQANAPTPADTLNVTVSREGRYAINGHEVAGSDEASLQAALAAVSAGRHDQEFIIEADGASPHQSVVTVMDAAGRLGFVNIAIATQEPHEH